MQLWKRVLAGSLGVLGLAAFGQAQAGNDRGGIEARSVPAASQRPPRPIQPDTYGTSQVSYYNIDAYELIPDNDIVTFNTTNGKRYQTSAGVFGVALHLPGGAQIVSMELDYYDNSVVGQAEASLVVCDYKGNTCNYHGHCGTTDTVCSGSLNAPGDDYTIVDLTGDDIVIDNFENRHFILAATTTADGSTAISRISIGYKLQVSPGPATATFTDVPTTHPFFKFVEALHAAGITNGYPDGRFGVNDPITRGQMAVFLSAALGLNWP